jgi:hypothetical protein
MTDTGQTWGLRRDASVFTERAFQKWKHQKIRPRKKKFGGEAPQKERRGKDTSFVIRPITRAGHGDRVHSAVPRMEHGLLPTIDRPALESIRATRSNDLPTISAKETDREQYSYRQV